MRFSTFLFPDSRDPARDGQVIDETIREAVLADELGVDIVWLAEHHFDGIAVYADPIVLAGALAAVLKRAGLGFAVIQTALHHPIRLAEQMTFLDHLLKGKLIVGLGRGSSFNIYDYTGFGIDHHEAEDRLDEAEAIMRRAWEGGEFEHNGRFWQLQVPMLRPAPYSRPHPPVIRGSSTEHSLVELAREGKPWMMNVQSLETTSRRVALYRETMLASGYDEAAVAANLDASWVWRNVFVAETDAEAERVGIPMFDRMTQDRAEMRNRYAARGQRIVPVDSLPGQRKARGEGLVYGAPARVAEDYAALERLGIGGVINTFRLGAMPHELAAESLTRFMREVAPSFPALTDITMDAAALRTGRRQAIAAAVIGNVLEWYDFSAYAFVATIIAKQFFPAGNDLAALLSTFAAFGIGFLARPLGGIVIGRMADRHGRKKALVLTILMMGAGTIAIGLIPGHATLGWAAPVLLVLARLAQGFSTGGEWGGSTSFIIEWAPEGRRGLYGSFHQASVSGGLLLGSGTTALLSTILAPAAMQDWGWRLPFILGGLLVPVGLYLRRNTTETPVFRRAQAAVPEASDASPVGLAARAFGFTMLWTVTSYVMLSFMPTFTQKFAGLSRVEALWSSTSGIVALVLAIPVMGHLSDKVGRKPLLLTCSIGFVVLAYPIFALMVWGSSLAVILPVQVCVSLLISFFSGPGPATIAELFPTRVRALWMSIGYSFAVAIFGGFSPYIATWLIAHTGSPLSPSYYVIATAVVTTIVIWRFKETAHSPLR